jgi:hypothetical protein
MVDLKHVIELRVRYGDSVVLQADSVSLYYIAIYGGYSRSDDGWMEVLGNYGPEYHVEIRAKHEIPNHKYRTTLRRLWRKLSGKKPKTSKV